MQTNPYASNVESTRDIDIEHHAPEGIEDKDGAAKTSNYRRRICMRCSICCGCTVVVLLTGAIVGYFVVLSIVIRRSIADFVTIGPPQSEYCSDELALNPSNLTQYIRWPGCKGGVVKTLQDFDSCGGTCFSSNLIAAMQDFNSQNEFRKVSLRSRPGPTGEQPLLTGWWLPAASSSEAVAPRIVLQHGFTSNSNKYHMQLKAFFLRSIGFSVLVMNLQDHCYSPNSIPHTVHWGYDYHYSLLGAWDYAQNDPDGILGGKLPPSKVGIMGLSMGGFIVNNAFGAEPLVPAAWSDSPPASPLLAFKEGASRQLPSFLVDILLQPVWQKVMDAAGVDLMLNTAAKNLPRGPDTQRPFALVQNKQDTTVFLENYIAIKHIVAAHPKKYNLTVDWLIDASCNGDTHAVLNVMYPNMYRRKLCKFWTHALNVPGGEDSCGLSKLPSLDV